MDTPSYPTEEILAKAHTLFNLRVVAIIGDIEEALKRKIIDLQIKILELDWY